MNGKSKENKKFGGYLRRFMEGLPSNANRQKLKFPKIGRLMYLKEKK